MKTRVSTAFTLASIAAKVALKYEGTKLAWGGVTVTIEPEVNTVETPGSEFDPPCVEEIPTGRTLARFELDDIFTREEIAEMADRFLFNVVDVCANTVTIDAKDLGKSAEWRPAPSVIGSCDPFEQEVAS